MSKFYLFDVYVSPHTFTPVIILGKHKRYQKCFKGENVVFLELSTGRDDNSTALSSK